MPRVSICNELDRMPLGRFNEGWPHSLELSCPPAEFSTPEEMLSWRARSETRTYALKNGSTTTIRHVFQHVSLTAEEEKRFSEFNEHVATHKIKIPDEIREVMGRMLQFNWRRFKDKYIQKTLEHIEATVKYKREVFPISDDEPFIKEVLHSGAMYWGGRDCLLRPVLVIVLKKLPKQYAAGGSFLFKRALLFCFEYACRFLYIPGIVETCSTIIDVRGVPVHAFPISTLNEVTSTLDNEYPFRMEQIWVISDVHFVHTGWSIFKQFLTEVQQQKLSFLKTSTLKELQKHFAPTQLERSLGGCKPTPKSFYPFPMPPGPFELDTKSVNSNAIPNCHQAADCVTRFGTPGSHIPQLWEPTAMRRICSLLNIQQPPLVRESLGELELYTLLTTKSPPKSHLKIKHHRNANGTTSSNIAKMMILKRSSSSLTKLMFRSSSSDILRQQLSTTENDDNRNNRPGSASPRIAEEDEKTLAKATPVMRDITTTTNNNDPNDSDSTASSAEDEHPTRRPDHTVEEPAYATSKHLDNNEGGGLPEITAEYENNNPIITQNYNNSPAQTDNYASANAAQWSPQVYTGNISQFTVPRASQMDDFHSNGSVSITDAHQLHYSRTMRPIRRVGLTIDPLGEDSDDHPPSLGTAGDASQQYSIDHVTTVDVVRRRKSASPARRTNRISEISIDIKSGSLTTRKVGGRSICENLFVAPCLCMLPTQEEEM